MDRHFSGQMVGLHRTRELCLCNLTLLVGLDPESLLGGWYIPPGFRREAAAT